MNAPAERILIRGGRVIDPASGRDAVDIVRRGGVDVVVLDISMPGRSGLAPLAAIRPS